MNLNECSAASTEGSPGSVGQMGLAVGRARWACKARTYHAAHMQAHEDEDDEEEDTELLMRELERIKREREEER